MNLANGIKLAKIHIEAYFDIVITDEEAEKVLKEFDSIYDKDNYTIKGAWREAFYNVFNIITVSTKMMTEEDMLFKVQYGKVEEDGAENQSYKLDFSDFHYNEDDDDSVNLLYLYQLFEEELTFEGFENSVNELGIAITKI